ncbi:MAG: hypothetical protein ACYDDO_12680 [Acidiferrobacterales bacterium]
MLQIEANTFLKPLMEPARTGVTVAVQAAQAGDLTVDEALHLIPLVADEEDPQVRKAVVT